LEKYQSPKKNYENNMLWCLASLVSDMWVACKTCDLPKTYSHNGFSSLSNSLLIKTNPAQHNFTIHFPTSQFTTQPNTTQLYNSFSNITIHNPTSQFTFHHHNSQPNLTQHNFTIHFLTSQFITQLHNSETQFTIYLCNIIKKTNTLHNKSKLTIHN